MTRTRESAVKNELSWKKEFVFQARRLLDCIVLYVVLYVGLGSSVGWAPAGANLCVRKKECPTKFETRWLQEIPFSKELLTDNYCALGLLFESKICNNNNNNNYYK